MIYEPFTPSLSHDSHELRGDNTERLCAYCRAGCWWDGRRWTYDSKLVAPCTKNPVRSTT